MNKNIAVKIGENIAAARKAKGKTQAEVAEKLGIETTSLSRIERGVVTPSLPTLDNIADELRVSLSSLIDGVSVKTTALSETIASQLEMLSEADRLFLLGQMQSWVQRLKPTQRKR